MTHNHAPIRAISFDIDGTLLDFERAMREALGCCLQEVRRLAPAAGGRSDAPWTPETLTVDAMVNIRDSVACELEPLGWTLERVRHASFQEILRQVGMDGAPLEAHLTTLYLRERFARSRAYDDVLPALAALKKRYTLGVLTNGNSYPERCGLDGWFDFAAYAYDHGVRKPDPRLFEIAAGRARCRAADMLHVGDSLHSDVAGAKAAGARAVWVNRAGSVADEEIVPDWEIRSLDELVAICDTLDD